MTEVELFDDVNSLGATAYAALKPDKPDFTAVTSLIELKENFHPLMNNVFRKKNVVNRELARRRRNGQFLSERYIAVQFGWVPLLSDVNNFIEAFQGRKDRFDQLLRDENQWIRRHRYLGKESVGTVLEANWGTSSRNNPNLQPVGVSQCYQPLGTGHWTYVFHRDTWSQWCVGRSKYLLPPGPRDEAWKRRIYRRIMGGYLNPSQVWNIIPWSWMVDYFTGLGSFFEAASQGIADRVIFDYAYVMKETEKSITATCNQATWGPNQTPQRPSSRYQLVQTTKARVAASPFGWGLETPSAYQMSILGALGYSALPTL
jgi:hypothetical protein